MLWQHEKQLHEASASPEIAVSGFLAAMCRDTKLQERLRDMLLVDEEFVRPDEGCTGTDSTSRRPPRRGRMKPVGPPRRNAIAAKARGPRRRAANWCL